jgi:hypothetical protein
MVPNAVTRSHSGLRVIGVALALVGLTMLPGCWVTSINPLYEDGGQLPTPADPDVVVEKGLLGTWSFTDKDQCVTTLTIDIKERVYEIQTIENGEKCSDQGKVKNQEAKLVKLGDHEFLDVTARTEDVCQTCVAVHWIFLTQIDKESLSLVPINGEWLEKSLKQKRVAVATVDGDPDTLTASSKALKAFCRKYANDKDAFHPDPDTTFKRVASTAAQFHSQTPHSAL